MEKEQKKQNKIMIYPSDELDAHLREVAKSANRSLSNYICTILEHHFKGTMENL